MSEIVMKPIGTIYTPFKEAEGTPIQPARSGGTRGHIELLTELESGLSDLEGFSHIVLVYVFHLSSGFNLEVTPFLDTNRRGLFATRAPRRPNQIGLSVVRLLGIKKNRLEIEGVDMIDGTPLLDIKPYVPVFDQPTEVRLGWLQQKASEADTTRADDRFERN